MRNPAHKLFRSCFYLILIPGVLFIINACKKDVSPQEPQQTDITQLSKLFAERGYESNLTQPFGDTMSIIYTAAWDKAVRETPNDSTVFVTIELVPKLKNTKTGNIIPDANFVGFARYINAEITKTATVFYMALYTTNSAETKVILSTFTGSLTLKNLETNKSSYHEYLNGKRLF